MNAALKAACDEAASGEGTTRTYVPLSKSDREALRRLSHKMGLCQSDVIRTLIRSSALASVPVVFSVRGAS